MATPHVAGVVSLMLSQNPSLTPAQVKQRLQQTARAFPTGTGGDCTTALCGAGIVDANAALSSPVTPPPTRENFAAQSTGAIASASSHYSSGYGPASVNNGDRRGLSWGSGGGWNDASANVFPDWIRIDFPVAQSITEINVFTVQDNYTNPAEPTEAMPFTLYGLTDFDVQVWNGSGWTTITNGSVSGNDKVWRKFTFASVTTTAIRVLARGSRDGSWSRVTEIEAFGDAATRVNVAGAANGGNVVASSSYSSQYSPYGVINGDRRGLNWGAGGGWNDASPNAFPDSLQVNFDRTKSITEINVFTVQDNYTNPAEPTEAMTFTLYGLTDYDVQYWNGADWLTVPNGSVSGNNKVWRKFTFAPIATSAIRVLARGSRDGAWSRLTEIEAYGDATTRVNAARSSSGGSAVASSSYSDQYSPAGVVDGDRRGLNWGAGGGWNDASTNVFPDVLQVNFNGTKSINEINVFTVQDHYNNPVEPTQSTTFTLYGLTDFDVQVWNGADWVTVPNGSVSGNNNVWRKFTFAPIATSAIRVLARGSRDGWSRLTEIEAFVAQ